MLRLPDHWVWDSWYLRDDTGRWHVFFLRASRALLDPNRRHRHATIGHAVSADLRSWRLVADALVPSDAPAWDDLATWTGSTVRGPDDRWHLFYTGVGRTEDGLVQRIGLATSDDLMTWHRHGTTPLVEADPTWYELLDRDAWYEQAWRDPWVFADPGGNGWHMLITARANHGPAEGRGVIGHATSADLVNWTVRPPLTEPAGFGHLEVPQVAIVDGQPLLLFCTNAAVPGNGKERIWTVPSASTLGPWDLDQARPVDQPGLYAPRLVADAEGQWHMVGFLDEVDGSFVGELAGPIPVSYQAGLGLRTMTIPTTGASATATQHSSSA